ncbi:hypothetical protein V2J09_023903 [Rumex salicifolius]
MTSALLSVFPPSPIRRCPTAEFAGDNRTGPKMDSESKQERFRTRWTASLDKIFVDLVVEQIQLGNRPNNVFDKKTWSHIREEFNKQTGLNFNNNQLRKHFDVLRIRYNNLKSVVNQNNLSIEDSSTIGFALWDSLGVQTRPEPLKFKECPIYEQLSIMFADNGADGKYAQSSHYEDLENKSNGANDAETPHSEAPSSSRSLEDNMASVENIAKAMNMSFKRKRLPETHPNGSNGNEDQLQDAMAEALSDMISASKLQAATSATRDGNNYSITKCIRALDDIQDINQTLYFTALDVFEDPNFREIFLSLNGNEKRLQWLQHRCGNVSLGTFEV